MNTVRHVCPIVGCGWEKTGEHDSKAVSIQFQKHWNDTHREYDRWEVVRGGK